ncbi:MAG TPA: Yip1 family protein [Burkholderiaceae bacterium]
MNVIERAKAMLLQPAQTWPVIEAEPATVGSIYRDWLIIMAAIPAVCGFIGFTFIGTFFFRGAIVAGLGVLVASYVGSLIGAFVMMLIVDALAPTFGGTKNQVSAMKLVAYSLTASFVGGVFSLLPFLGSPLRLLAACYGIYLFYLGVPGLMKVTQEKAAGFTAAVVVIAIVVGIVIGSLFAAFGGMGMMFAGRSSSPSFSVSTPNGDITVDTAALEAAGKRMEAARARAEAAQKAGDTASAGAAIGDMMGALTGAGGTPIAPADLKAQLPETLGALKRESFETTGGNAIGIASSVAKATYTGGDNQRAELSITDLGGGLGGLASVAAWANITVDKETPDGIEKTYKDGGRTIHEQYRKDGSHAEYTVILKNGVIVETSGERIDGATLKSMAAAVNLDAIEAMKRPAKT